MSQALETQNKKHKLITYITAIPLGVVAFLMLIFVPSAHVTMCMVCAIGYSAGLPMERYENTINKVVSFLSGGILFYTVYAATTFFFTDIVLENEVENRYLFLEPAWIYHLFINFGLLVMFKLKKDVMPFVIYGAEFFMITSPVMYLIGNVFDRTDEGAESERIPYYIVTGIGLFLIHRAIAFIGGRNAYNKFLSFMRKSVIISLWIYTLLIITFIFLAALKVFPERPEDEFNENSSSPQFEESFPSNQFGPCFSPDGQEKPCDGPPKDQELLSLSSLEDLFGVNASDTFLVQDKDLDKISSTVPYNGTGSGCDHKGAHIYFKRTGFEYSVDIVSPVEAIVENINLCNIATTAQGYQHDKFDVLLEVGHHNETSVILVLAFEPFAGLNCQENPNFYEQFILVEKGQRVQKGEVIARMPKLLTAIEDNTHIHFHMSYYGDGVGELYCPNIFNTDIEKKFHSLNNRKTCLGIPYPQTVCYRPAPGEDLRELVR